MKDFFENTAYSVLIAKLAIVFQSIMTVLICIGISIAYYNDSPLLPFFSLCFTLDILFIIIHLTYRGLYTGKKMLLRKTEKLILVTHVITSVFALYGTYLFITERVLVNASLAQMTLICWILSLTFGILFYIKKYTGIRILE